MPIVAVFDKILTDAEIDFYLAKGYIVMAHYIDKKTYILQFNRYF